MIRELSWVYIGISQNGIDGVGCGFIWMLDVLYH